MLFCCLRLLCINQSCCKQNIMEHQAKRQFLHYGGGRPIVSGVVCASKSPSVADIHVPSIDAIEVPLREFFPNSWCVRQPICIELNGNVSKRLMNTLGKRSCSETSLRNAVCTELLNSRLLTDKIRFLGSSGSGGLTQTLRSLADRDKVYAEQSLNNVPRNFLKIG